MTRTNRIYRSRHGELLGVCQGIADWRELPVGPIRLLLIILALSTAVVPILIIYVLAGILMPLEPAEGGFKAGEYDEDIRGKYRENRHHTVHDIKREFDDLKEKVTNMEDDVFDREKEWDNKFRSKQS
ncbi:MAG: PspC domain-containing protein [Spirochaetota bacterium]